MKTISVCLGLLNGILTAGMLLPAMAQVISDGTTNTTVNPSGNNFTILNGIAKGSNLFHSFSNFSVPTGGSATFDLVNTPNITTIFNRVTGGNVSNIDGLIRTINNTNSVNLFLLNSNGIMFGPNAQLNIGGSFVGTTATSIGFQDGSEFGTTNLTAPLLTMSVPIGLQFGSNPGAIALQGTGHALQVSNLLAPPVQTGRPSSRLEVQPNQTLALIGGNVNLQGSTLTANQGRIELGGVANGTVNLQQASNGWSISYQGLQDFRDVSISNRSAIDANGTNQIQIVGKTVTLNQGSIVLATNRAFQPGGNLQVTASESFDIAGDTSSLSGSFLLSNAFVGSGANITVTSPKLRLQNGIIGSTAYGLATGGNVEISASEIQVDGQFPATSRRGIVTSTSGRGNAGLLTVSTEHLNIFNGGYISSSTSGSGMGGNVTVNARDIQVDGFNSLSRQQSLISAATLRDGDAGNLTVNTATLSLTNGGNLSTSTLARGQAGSLVVNAESIGISGGFQSPDGFFSSSAISSAATIIPQSLQQILNLPAVPSGISGNVIINTKDLNITEGGVIRVNNEGLGNAGTVKVNARSLNLDRGSINAITTNGEGGNISLQTQLILLRNQSSITATAGASGNGGNLAITAPVIVGLENSDITANAIAGRGGNIEITAQGIFGLKFRNQLTRENDITASSQFGVNGTVDINNFGVDPSSGLVYLSVNLVDSSQQIATGCSNNTGSSFVATGRGGVPQNPNQQVMSARTWSDIRVLSAYRKNSTVTAQIPTSPETLVQATSWRRNAQGKIELVADKSTNQMPQALTCAAIPR